MCEAFRVPWHNQTSGLVHMEGVEQCTKQLLRANSLVARLKAQLKLSSGLVL